MIFTSLRRAPSSRHIKFQHLLGCDGQVMGKPRGETQVNTIHCSVCLFVCLFCLVLLCFALCIYLFILSRSMKKLACPGK